MIYIEKIKIHPDKELEDRLTLLCNNARFIYNWMLNESIKLMEKQGYIDEFICSDKNILNILKQKNIIWTAYYNDYDMLIPTQYFSNKPSSVDLL